MNRRAFVIGSAALVAAAASPALQAQAYATGGILPAMPLAASGEHAGEFESYCARLLADVCRASDLDYPTIAAELEITIPFKAALALPPIDTGVLA